MKRVSFLILLSCALNAHAQNFFEPLPSQKDPKTIVIPQNPVEVDVLCISNKSEAFDPAYQKFGPVKDGFSDLIFVPSPANPSMEGTIMVSHNINKVNNDFRPGQIPSAGDGGGVTLMKVKKNAKGHWEVQEMTAAGKKHKYKNISFATVGGATNLSGFFNFSTQEIGKDYKIYLGEEAYFNSNSELFAKSTSGSAGGYRDTSNYTIPSNQGIASNKVVKRFENMGWLIEMDPVQGKAVKKHYTVGRFSHSDAIQAGPAIMMISNTKPSLLFKLENSLISQNNYLDSLNQDVELSVYFYDKKSKNYGWKLLNILNDPNDPELGSYQNFDLVKNVVKQALDSGAVMFSNLKKFGYDLNNNDKNIYLTENGLENSEDYFSNKAKMGNGYLPPHLIALDKKDGTEDGKFSDPFGRILRIDLNGNLSVFMEGGQSHGDLFFSNPYDITPTLSYTPDEELGFKEEYIMIINEKVTGVDKGRNPETVKDLKDAVNEVIWMNFDKESDNPAPSSMKRFMVAPKGSAITGGEYVVDIFDLENTFTYFTVINTPMANSTNDSVFYNSMVVAVTLKAEDQPDFWTGTEVGIKDFLTPDPVQLNNITIWPNPASQTLYLSKKTSVSILNINGIEVMKHLNSESIDISKLEPGIYFIRTSDNEVVKIIIQ